jgi:hypothetical protein
VFILATAFPAFFHLIGWGQTSAAALACFTLIVFLLRDRREFLAGLVLGCLIFKPQLGLAAAIVFVSIGAWKTVLGAALSAAEQLSLGILYCGIEPFRHWVHILWNVRTVLPLLAPKPYQTHSLRTYWSRLVPWPPVSLILYILCAAVVLAVTIACSEAPPRRAPASTVFSPAFHHCARSAAPHGLRPGDSGARVYSAVRLAC